MSDRLPGTERLLPGGLPPNAALTSTMGASLSADLAWALLFIVGVSGLLMLLAWLEPEHQSSPLLQPMSRPRVLQVTAQAEVVERSAGPEEFDG
jgi:hypothetical protein